MSEYNSVGDLSEVGGCAVVGMDFGLMVCSPATSKGRRCNVATEHNDLCALARVGSTKVAVGDALCSNRDISLVDLEAGKVTHWLRGHSRALSYGVFDVVSLPSISSSRLISCGFDETLHLWDFDSADVDPESEDFSPRLVSSAGSFLSTDHFRDHAPYSLFFDSSRDLCLSGGRSPRIQSRVVPDVWPFFSSNSSTSVCVWDVERSFTEGAVRRTSSRQDRRSGSSCRFGSLLGVHSDLVTGVAMYDLGSKMAVSCSADGTMQVYDVTQGEGSMARGRNGSNSKSLVQTIRVKDTGRRRRGGRGRGGNEICSLGALCVAPEDYALYVASFCPSSSGRILRYDIRRMKKPMLSFAVHKRGCPILGIAKLSEGYASCSFDRTIAFWDGEKQAGFTKHYRTGKRHCSIEFVGQRMSHLWRGRSMTEEENERLDFVFSESGLFFNFSLVGSTSTIQCPKSLLTLSSLLREREEEGVEEEDEGERETLHVPENIDLGVIDEEVFVRLLFGVAARIRTRALQSYFSLFVFLGMKRHALLICRIVESTLTDPRVLIELLGQSVPDSAFFESCVNALRGQLPLPVDVMERCGELGVGSERLEADVVSLASLDDLRLSEEESDSLLSFDALAVESRKGLLDDLSSLSDVTLVTPSQDVGLIGPISNRIPAHLALLVFRSRFFFKMLSFEGIERLSLHDDDPHICIDLLQPGSLKLLLEFVYSGSLSTEDLGSALLLFRFSHMFDELELRVAAMTRIKAITDFLVSRDMFRGTLTKCGYLLADAGGAFREITEYWSASFVISPDHLKEIVFESETKHRLDLSENRLGECEDGLSRLSELVSGQNERLDRMEVSLAEIRDLVMKLTTE